MKPLFLKENQLKKLLLVNYVRRGFFNEKDKKASISRELFHSLNKEDLETKQHDAIIVLTINEV